MSSPDETPTVAIVSVAGRFPGANGVDQLWANLCAGVTSTRANETSTLEQELVERRWVAAGGFLEDVDLFDAEFFGIGERDAALLDPQGRIALECVWELLEAAGCVDPSKLRTGIYLGSSLSEYMFRNLVCSESLQQSVGALALLVRNDKDFLPSLISHRLDLRGPSVSVNTACSSSLVATHLGVQALLTGECDLAIAGGVSLHYATGYIHEAGGIYAADGYCRPFDRDADGTVGGSGAAFVLLKRTEDAVRDGDTIYAVIRGSAINNDGASRAGFTAPGPDGQRAVIQEALSVAGVSADSLGFVEGHGTGTSLGDGIELAVLSDVFKRSSRRSRFCALGSVKGNLGHLDAAAGVTGLIKCALALFREQIPPTVNLRVPRPELVSDETPFFVNTRLIDWPATSVKRRAGVSSFGMGGTNAHFVLEEAPERIAMRGNLDSTPQLLTLSARSPEQLGRVACDLAEHLGAHDVPLEDAAFTLGIGRRALKYRRAVVCDSVADAVRLLQDSAGGAVFQGLASEGPVPIAFAFPEWSDDAQGLSSAWYSTQPSFRGALDACVDALAPHVDFDPRTLFDCIGLGNAVPRERTNEYALVTWFSLQYSLAQVCIAEGLLPEAVIGYGLGEYTSACVAGILTLQDAMRLVLSSSRLIYRSPLGVMLAVAATEDELLAVTGMAADIAAFDAPAQLTLSGYEPALRERERRLSERGVTCTWLSTRQPLRSQAMRPVAQAIAKFAGQVVLQRPKVPMVSSITGTWVSAEEATSPSYWGRQVLEPVRFGKAVQCLLERPTAFVEIGPGRSLASLISQNLSGGTAICCSLASGEVSTTPQIGILRTLGRLWVHGADIDWSKRYAAQRRRRVPLPGYPFARKRFWIDAPTGDSPQRPVSHAQPELPRAPSAVADAFESSFGRLGLGTGIAVQGEDARFAPKFSLFCAACAFEYFTQVARFAEGAPLSVATLEAALGVLPEFGPLVEYLVELLHHEGFVERNDSTIFRADAAVPVSADLAAPLLAEFPQFSSLVELVGDLVRNYLRLLSVPGAAIEFLYGGAHAAKLELRLSKENVPSSNAGVLMSALAHATSEYAQRPESSLRVLEVGMGMGILTERVAPLMAARGAEYWATDVSMFFVQRAREQPWSTSVELAVFDACRAPEQQASIQGKFDVILAHNALHAVPDASVALRNLRRLTKPGGIIAAIEQTSWEPWVHMVWGLAPGWWRPHGGSKLLTSAAWVEVFKGAGLVETKTFPVGTPSQADDHSLIFSRTPKDIAELLDAAPKKSRQIQDWFYVPYWRREAVFEFGSGQVHGRHHLVVFADERHALGEYLKRVAEDRQYTVTMVRRCERVTHDPARREYGIRPTEARDYKDVFAALERTGLQVETVFHLWSLDSPSENERDAWVKGLECSLHSVTCLAQALGSGFARSTSVTVVSADMQDVLGTEALRPQLRTLLGPVKLASLEYPSLRFRSVDIEGSRLSSRLLQVAEALLTEGTVAAGPTIIAHRGGYRWTQGMERSALGTVSRGALPVRRGAVYVVAGGLGGIGLELARWLSHQVECTLVLIGRSEFPPREAWMELASSMDTDPGLNRKLRILLDIEGSGSRVIVRKLDVGNELEVRSLCEHIRSLGPIRGVIHSAGVRDLGGVIHRRSRSDTDTAIAAKVWGAFELHAATIGDPLDFFVMNASLGGVTLYKLKFGEVGYVSANEFFVAFAQYRKRLGLPALAVNWTDWSEVGMWAAAQAELAGADNSRPVSRKSIGSVLDLMVSITPSEGLDAFGRLLAQSAPVVDVCCQDLERLLVLQDGYDADALRDLLETNQPSPVREQAAVPVAEGLTGIQSILKRIWCDVLGASSIGLDDDFFELGGDSLLGVRLVARVTEHFPSIEGVAVLYDYPTIAQMAVEIGKRVGQDDPESRGESSMDVEVDILI